jgi:hypothetical protein
MNEEYENEKQWISSDNIEKVHFVYKLSSFYEQWSLDNIPQGVSDVAMPAHNSTVNNGVRVGLWCPLATNI